MIRLKECIFQWGGGTINGDLHITGNLIIGDSDVAEDNQVTSDLIQDLYNKVYKPSQTIYVSNNGDDNNDGKTIKTPIKTLSKVNDLQISDIPNLTIYLDNTCSNIEYDLEEAFDFNSQIGKSGSEGKAVVITPFNYNLAASVDKRPIINLCFSRAFSNWSNSLALWFYGFIFCCGCKELRITGMHLKLKNRSDYDKRYSGFITTCGNLSINRTTLDLEDYDMVNSYWNNTLTRINIIDHSYINGSGYLLRTNDVYIYDSNTETTAGTEHHYDNNNLSDKTYYIESVISKLSSIDKNISSKGNGGCTTDVYVNFTNIK